MAPLAAAEAAIWKDVAAMLTDAASMAPAFGILSKRVSLRQGDGRVTFANPADNAAFGQRKEQLVTVIIRWDALAERLTTPAVVPEMPVLPGAGDGNDPATGDGAP